MPLMKNRYKTLRSVFPDTTHGKLTISLAVGQKRVQVIDAMGIKLTLNREDVRASEHVLLTACRKADKAQYNNFCDDLDALDA